MEITLNGKKKHFTETLSIEKLLGELKINPKNCVVEVNRQPVEKELYAQQQLYDGDEVELARFIGGG